MVFEGPELREILRRTAKGIKLRNAYGRYCRLLTVDEALALDLDLFVGVGNGRRLRFLRPKTIRQVLNAGSRTTRRLKDEQGRNIAHPHIREHRVLPRLEL